MMIMLWNICMRVLYFIGVVIFNGFLYYIFREVMKDHLGWVIYLFDTAFVIWVIAEAAIRIVSGGASNVFKWAIGRFW